MRQAQKKQIGSYTFEVSMLPPMQAHRLLTRTVKALGPVLGTVATSFGSVDELVREAGRAAALAKGAEAKAAGTEGADGKPNEGDFGWAEALIKQATESLDEKLLDELIDALKQVTSVIGPAGAEHLPQVFESIFQGELQLMYQWFFFAWKVQYADFFASFGKLKKT